MYGIVFSYLFLLFGLCMIYNKKELPFEYVFLLLAGIIKIVLDYRLCTFAYIECKSRGIPRDESYINRFIDPIVDTRYTDHVYIFCMIAYFIILYYLLYQGKLKEYIKHLKDTVRNKV